MGSSKKRGPLIYPKYYTVPVIGAPKQGHLIYGNPLIFYLLQDGSLFGPFWQPEDGFVLLQEQAEGLFNRPATPRQGVRPPC